MLFKLSRHLDNCTSLVRRQEIDMWMQQDNQNVKPSMDSLMFAMEIHTIQNYLGIKFIERTLIAHSLACREHNINRTCLAPL